jgi:hypothetical protein
MFMSLLLPQAAASDQGFLDFEQEAKRITDMLDCPRPGITSAEPGLGALYGCIMGAAETAKVWVNESADRPGVVSNVKVMWNDWTRDIGYGLHADTEEAAILVETVADLYAPALKKDLLDVFFDSENQVIEDSSFRFEYMLSRGPGIDEHLLVITEK